MAEREYLEGHKVLYPISSLGYEQINLAIAIWDMKIAIWAAAAGLNAEEVDFLLGGLHEKGTTGRIGTCNN